MSDNENIRVFKNGNVSIDAPIDAPITLEGVKTIVIENGDLIVKSNSIYADANSSFAFIVKNGYIIIEDGVTRMVGVYMTLPNIN